MSEKIKCLICGGALESDFADKTFQIAGKSVKINDIPTLKCQGCGELYFDKVGNSYIDRALEGSLWKP